MPNSRFPLALCAAALIAIGVSPPTVAHLLILIGGVFLGLIIFGAREQR